MADGCRVRGSDVDGVCGVVRGGGAAATPAAVGAVGVGGAVTEPERLSCVTRCILYTRHSSMHESMRGTLDALVGVLLVVNGAYDVCAGCILWLPTSCLGRLHLDVFLGTHSAGARRVFAYWIVTYGVECMFADAYKSQGTDAMSVLSYLVETVAYYNETVVFMSVDRSKSRFEYVACVFLGVLVG